MSHAPVRTRAHDHDRKVRRRLSAALVVGALALTGCGAGSDDPDGAAPEADPTVSSGVPEVCKEAFPAAFGAPDIAEISMLPAGWPEPPPGSTLCQTAETIGGSRENADYVTTLSAEQVLEAYEDGLDPALGAAREEGPLGGEVLVGAVDGVDFQITPGTGKFTIAFAR
ncbi:hypothetical protein EFK50_04690 [Nocardioides marmoriginsengisoli]|uniref:DUF3558 domain-containing protein n=1 Tax=Nocardioides marmoriginsengisoli TaxID=661483 RepID=A0A3N0CPN1_9ACTN|nr:hypothetical protein [Nocardioides marmoriginsengisoli]RNL65261.1 hypothetical protein EFK50_04690 [Nocardioides marmoriginsengisoli]